MFTVQMHEMTFDDLFCILFTRLDSKLYIKGAFARVLICAVATFPGVQTIAFSPIS